MTAQLDRIEAILVQLAAPQAEQQQQFQQQLQENQQQFQQQWQETRQVVESNARASAANSNKVAELSRSQADFRASIEDGVGMIVICALSHWLNTG